MLVEGIFHQFITLLNSTIMEDYLLILLKIASNCQGNCNKEYFLTITAIEENN